MSHTDMCEVVPGTPQPVLSPPRLGIALLLGVSLHFSKLETFHPPSTNHYPLALSHAPVTHILFPLAAVPLHSPSKERSELSSHEATNRHSPSS